LPVIIIHKFCTFTEEKIKNKNKNIFGDWAQNRKRDRDSDREKGRRAEGRTATIYELSCGSQYKIFTYIYI